MMTQTNSQKNSGNSFMALCGMLILIFFLSALTYTKTPSDHEITKDAKENTISSYHLFDKGMISYDGINKSNFREPLPIAILALHMAFFTDIPKKLNDVNLITTQPHFIKQINLVNLLYIIPAFFVMWYLCFSLTKSHLLSAIFIFLSWISFYVRPWYLGRPLSEYAASLLILVISVFTLKLFVTNQNSLPKFLFLNGVLVGILALTKAAAFFVGLCFIPIVLIYMGNVYKIQFKRLMWYGVISYVGLFVTVGPWMIRNYMIKPSAENRTATNSYAIAGRGGAILMGRASLNQQVAPDPLGAMYVYSPPLLQHYLFENYFGFKDKDLWQGGKYASLNRNVIFVKSKQQNAIDEIESKKDSEYKKNAADSITANIKAHLITSAVVAWRGIWSFDGGNHFVPGGKTWFSLTWNFLCFTSMLSLPLISLVTRNREWFIVSLFPFGMFVVYALGTHFIPHYSAQLIPMAIFSSLIIIYKLTTPIISKFKSIS